MTQSKVFIGMPVYNGERHLPEAIDSLLNQSFKNFTLYISDDASNEATRAIGESYAARDSRVVYFRQPKNLGMFGNMKFVLDQANAPYFMWAAQDDIREKNYLAVCVNKFEEDKG